MTLTIKGLQPLTRIDHDFNSGNLGGLDVFVTPQMYAPEGTIIGDGTPRALSTVYSTLTDAQQVFQFATSLTQTLDYVCIKAMSNAALGGDASSSTVTYADIPTAGSTVSVVHNSLASYTVNEHVGSTLYMRYPNGVVGQAPIISNTATSITLSPALPYDYHDPATGLFCGMIGYPGSLYDCSMYGIGIPGEHGYTDVGMNIPMFIPAGTYDLGNDTWLIRNVVGAYIMGAGRIATHLKSSNRVFATDGFWYSRVEGISFTSTGAVDAVVDIDGNVPGQPYATRGVQGNTFKDVFVDGTGLAETAMAITRLGNPPGPGAQGSENLFIACHFNNATFANWFSTGYNALQNTFIGGNFQGHQTHGIYILAGSIYVFSVGFQSTYKYTQILNDGYDINANSGGVGDRIVVIGCRTESARFYRGGGSQPPVLIGNTQGYGGDVEWTPNLASYYDVNDTIIKLSATTGRQMYRVTTAGTSGGDTVTDADIFSGNTIGKSTKAWTVNQWAGWRITITGGTGFGDHNPDANYAPEYVIASNTATTLTITGTFRTTPSATTDFQIEPHWPDSGTFADGSVVWTMTPVNVIDCTTTKASFVGNAMAFGYMARGSMDEAKTLEISHDYTATFEDEFLLCLPTSDITIKLPTSAPRGKRYYVKKENTNAFTVTVMRSDGGHIEGVANTGVIPGGSRGWIVFEKAGGGGPGSSMNYWVVSRSLDLEPRVKRLRIDLGTTLVDGDFALSAGWGSTASVAVASGCKDCRGNITVTSAGTGQTANPTVTLTFKDGAWPLSGPPFPMVCRGTGAQRTVPMTIDGFSTTTVRFRFEGTPVAAETYVIHWMVLG